MHQSDGTNLQCCLLQNVVHFQINQVAIGHPRPFNLFFFSLIAAIILLDCFASVSINNDILNGKENH